MLENNTPNNNFKPSNHPSPYLSVKASDLILSARSWMDTPWRHHQKCKKAGVDCVHLLMAIADEHNINYGTIGRYRRRPKGNQLLQHLSQYFRAKSLYNLLPGDILLFQIQHIPHHVGIYTGASLFIHADAAKEKVCYGVLEPKWLQCLTMVFQIPNIDYDIKEVNKLSITYG